MSSSATDVLLLALALGVGASLGLAAWLAHELMPRRPLLPALDCPPAGLGRLVPVGWQVDSEVRSGQKALEAFLRTQVTRG